MTGRETSTPPWQEPIERARRGLRRNEALRRASRLGAVAAAWALGVATLEAAGVEAGWGAWSLAIALGLVGALWALDSRVTGTEAAIFVDRRADGEETFASALALHAAGEVPAALERRATERAAQIDVGRVVRYRPGLAARLFPVLVGLALAVRLGGDSARAAATPGPGIPVDRAVGIGVPLPLPLPPGAAGAGSRPEAGSTDGEPEVRQAYERWVEHREALERLATALERAGVDLSGVAPVDSAALAAPEAIDELERALAEASRRLEGDRDLSEDVEVARQALRQGALAREAALQGLTAALSARRAEAAAAVSELRRLGRSAGLYLGETAASGRSGFAKAEIPPGGFALGADPGAVEMAMDRGVVPGEYRDIVRRYFDRKPEDER